MKTWNDLFTDEAFQRNEAEVFRRIDELQCAGVPVYPAPAGAATPETMKMAVYRAFALTPLDKVKVVILGQDPYHGPGQANGLAFSVFAGVVLPPSLRNIFKELQNDLGGDLRVCGDLSDWARQGVLLLNSSLSVVEGQPNSMSGFWEPLTDEMIRFVDENIAPVVFVLWGNNAKKKKTLIKRNAGLIVEAAHPSPLSASRGFFGSKPFSRINWLLSLNGIAPVVWK